METSSVEGIWKSFSDEDIQDLFQCLADGGRMRSDSVHSSSTVTDDDLNRQLKKMDCFILHSFRFVDDMPTYTAFVMNKNPAGQKQQMESTLLESASLRSGDTSKISATEDEITRQERMYAVTYFSSEHLNLALEKNGTVSLRGKRERRISVIGRT